MSQAAILYAVRDQLRAAFGYGGGPTAALKCEVRYDGRPPAMAGELFIAVHANGWRGDSGDWDLGEKIGVAVTVSRRVAYAPDDRTGTEVFLKTSAGLSDVCRMIITKVHKSLPTLRIANESYLSLSAPWPGGFVEALLFDRVLEPAVKGPDWFSSDQDGVTGLAQTVLFVDAKRLQVPSSGGAMDTELT